MGQCIDCCWCQTLCCCCSNENLDFCGADCYCIQYLWVHSLLPSFSSRLGLITMQTFLWSHLPCPPPLSVLFLPIFGMRRVSNIWGQCREPLVDVQELASVLHYQKLVCQTFGKKVASESNQSVIGKWRSDLPIHFTWMLTSPLKMHRFSMAQRAIPCS